MNGMNETNGLATSTTPVLVLRHPTELEKEQTWTKNCENWGKALGLSAYLDRERFLTTVPLNCDGGLTHWILVDESPPNERPILASCESVRKRALVRVDGVTKETITHGIGSVFCYPEHRGRGYPKKMLNLLGTELATWQAEEGECYFSFLYSDIGKSFYTKLGWHAHPSKHLMWTPSKTEVPSGEVQVIEPYSDLMKELCKRDEALIRDDIVKATTPAVTLIPDYDTMQWHHGREGFMTNRLFGHTPVIKGAVCGLEGSRVWAIWTRSFYGPLDDPNSGNALHILRLVVEDEDPNLLAQNVESFSSILALARAEAANWSCLHVELWNPTEYQSALIGRVGVDFEEVDRDQDSIPSLMWYGDEPGKGRAAEVEWLHNEKFGWC